MTVFKLSRLSKTYGRRTVLDIEDLEIEAQRVYALLGPNGAGKTTLLNILGFLERPDAGQLHYRSRLINFAESALQALRREVVVLDQHPIMFTTSVYKNVEFGLKIRGFPREQRADIIREALDLVGMGAFANSAAHRLSGGETQRVAIARALALSPRVFLCDEPTSNVDVENQEIILDILQRINAEKNCTIVFTTHDRSQATRLAHHILFMDHGRLRPAFYENILSGRILSRDASHIRLDLGGNHLQVSASEELKFKSSEVRILIDARMISLVDPQGKDLGPNTLQGKVVALSQENEHIRVLADLGIALNLLLPIDRYQRRPLTIGADITVGIPSEAVQLVE
jgi:tungstate transport system ATP-binding protein